MGSNTKSIWKDIDGFPGKSVSIYGDVRTTSKSTGGMPKIVPQTLSHGGYPRVSLWNGVRVKSVKVHTLVAKAWVDGYKDGLVVNHKDGNKANNFASNLEWVSVKDNNAHAFRLGLNSNKRAKNSRSILTEENVLEIKSSKDTAKKLSDKFGCSVWCIYNVRENKTWRLDGLEDKKEGA